MGTYTLEIEALGSYSLDSPILEIWSEGSLIASYAISSSGTSISTVLNYGGTLPSSLEFKFNDTSLELLRSIEIRSVKINNQHVNRNNFLSDDNLTQGQSSTVDVSAGAFLFEGSEPPLSEFASPTIASTTGMDDIMNLTGADYVVDGLAGRDSIVLGSGADKVNGNDGDDYIRGGEGDDLLYGAENDDLLYGDEGNDNIYGGNGIDGLYGGSGHDAMHGGAGDDALVGNDGDDILVGGEGYDNLNGGNGADSLYGGAGNDYLIAAAGNDSLDGGDGADVLFAGSGDDIVYSGDSDNAEALIASVLAANEGIHYSVETNSFYEYVTTATSWTAANIAANGATLAGLAGVNGHLVTITSQAENDYIGTIVGLNNVWTAGSDATVEGEWRWMSGPETGMQYTDNLGNSVNGLYENFVGAGIDLLGINDYMVRQADGTWVEQADILNTSYVIEWEASSLIASVNKDKINGGNGADTLYGGEGIDLFIFNSLDAVDTVYDVNFEEHDQLDIGALVSYDSLTNDIHDFVQLTEAGGNTTIAIDSDGLANGVNFVDMAIIKGETGFDLNQMLAADNLLV